MGFNELYIALVSIFIALIGLYIQIRVFKRNKLPKEFNGKIGSDYKTNQKFIKFISKLDKQIVKLDINFEGELPEQNSEGYFEFTVNNKYDDITQGGLFVRIKTTSDDDFFYDNRWTSKRVAGYFKIIGLLGPNQGIFTALLKPVGIENIK